MRGWRLQVLSMTCDGCVAGVQLAMSIKILFILCFLTHPHFVF
jgi:hypothetical protein